MAAIPSKFFVVQICLSQEKFAEISLLEKIKQTQPFDLYLNFYFKSGSA